MRFLKLCALLVVILAVTGCGTPDSYYLNPPVASTLAAGITQFSFANPDHSADFGVAFTGFELYYRFYNVGDVININAYDPTNPSDPYTQLTGNGFYPIRSITDTLASQSIPLIAVSSALAATAFTVQVNITGSGNNTSGIPQSLQAGNYILGASPAVEIRRRVTDPNTAYGFKNFLSNSWPPTSGATGPNYYTTDADLSGITLTASTVYVALYAVSYGLVTLSTPTRSTPVYLGYATVNLNLP